MKNSEKSDEMDYPDIYYIPQWAELNAERDNGVFGCFDYTNEYGRVYYPYIKREIDIRVNGDTFFDIITPYGFNGPIVMENTNKEKLLDEFDVRFTEYCIENHIVAEYVRFSPWLKNHSDFKKYYTLRYNNQTLCIDLQKDFFYEEFSSKCRNVVRKAVKSGVKVEFDFLGTYTDEFLKLYNLMAEKHNVSQYYIFDENFINKIFDYMKGNVLIARALYENIHISSAIFLYDGNYIHYHLSGNDYKYTSLGANSLIIYEVAKWGKEHGKKEFHLGGATQDSLFNFKKSFTKNGILDYYVGMRVRDEKMYNILIQLKGRNNNGYFPEYRG